MAAWFSPIACVAERNNFAGKAVRPKRLISPHEGEMSGRTEGGAIGRRHGQQLSSPRSRGEDAGRQVRGGAEV